MHLISNRYFQLKYKSSIHNVAFYSETFVLFESGEKLMLIERLIQFKIICIALFMKQSLQSSFKFLQ